ncbi:hypothetical protein PGIGA_G00203920 [Pangasianodon gigas]|uniref:Uncharacterized protein n=1 Tax=Pangasianodon gigas TaxID=30993 RepID=A0ACC5WF61_PANGG|nr:hypothetical protein [Pangasianodon gigas]
MPEDSTCAVRGFCELAWQRARLQRARGCTGGEASARRWIQGRGFSTGLYAGGGASSRRCTQGGAGLEPSAGNITNPEFQVAAASRLWLTTAAHKHSL